MGGGGRQKSSVTTDDGGGVVCCVCVEFLGPPAAACLCLPEYVPDISWYKRQADILYTYDIIFGIRSVPLLCQRWKEKWVGRTEMELAGNGKCLSLTRHHTMYNNQCNEGQVFKKSTYYCLSVTNLFRQGDEPAVRLAAHLTRGCYSRRTMKGVRK